MISSAPMAAAIAPVMKSAGKFCGFAAVAPMSSSAGAIGHDRRGQRTREADDPHVVGRVTGVRKDLAHQREVDCESRLARDGLSGPDPGCDSKARRIRVARRCATRAQTVPVAPLEIEHRLLLLLQLLVYGQTMNRETA